MPTVAVLEPAPLLAPLLSRTLSPSLADLEVPDCPGDRQSAPDLLVLSPRVTCLPDPCPPCRILLTPGPVGDGSAASVVSYGPSPRDSLTFSSLREGGMVLALQRELVTLTGRRVERQELALPCRGEPLLTLAWAGTLLLAGEEPETLAGLARQVFP